MVMLFGQSDVSICVISWKEKETRALDDER